MARVYRKPDFNLTGRVWFNILPDDLSTWSGDVPTTPPNATFPCQLYYPRWGLDRWLHALSDSCFKSLLNAGCQELRYDLATDLRAPWGVATVSKWSDVPLAEVPVSSGRLYAVVLQEAKHLGFPNQYAVAVLAQLGPIPPTPPPPPPPIAANLASGSAMRVRSVNPLDVAIATGGAIGIHGVTVDLVGKLPTGGAMGALVVAGYAIVSGGAMTAEGSIGTYPARLPSGSGMSAAGSSPTSIAAYLGSGGGETDQELFPSRSARLGSGDGFGGTKTPPGDSQSVAEGGAMTATVGNLVKVNPCPTVGVPKTITLACLTQSGTLSGWTGQAVVLTYNSGSNNWTGTLTKSGHSGTITATSSGSGVMNFSGSSSTFWNLGANLSNDTVACGPPFSGTSGNHPTNEGLNTGNTTWSYN